MIRIIGNAVRRVASAAKLPSVGSWLNASKSESVLDRGSCARVSESMLVLEKGVVHFAHEEHKQTT